MEEKEKFQTAFPEDTEPQPEEINPFKVGEVLCQYGCGRPGKYFSHGPDGWRITTLREESQRLPCEGRRCDQIC